MSRPLAGIIALGVASLVSIVAVSACFADYVLLWEDMIANFQAPIRSSVADYDGDRISEIATLWPDDVLRIRDALTGALEFEYAGPDWFSTASAVGEDLDRDGSFEIFVFGIDGRVAVIDYVEPTGSIGQTASPPARQESSLHPNPFNLSATIDYALPHKGKASIQVYDVSGRLVRTLVDATMEGGQKSVTWDGRDSEGHSLPSATYFYSLSIDGQVLDKGKAVILK